MDGERFDAMTVTLAQAGASRRSLLQRIGGGGLAAMLAVLGLGVVGREDAEAKNCRRKCRKKFNDRNKRKRCVKKCKNKGGGGGSGGAGGAGGAGGGGGTGRQPGFPIVGADPPLTQCTSGASCASGNCANIVAGIGVCLACDGVNLCGAAGSQQCCVVDATCAASGLCVFPGR